MARQHDTEAEADTYRARRSRGRGLEKWSAIQRLAGSSILGTVAAWKLLMYDAAHDDVEGLPWILIVWIVIALLAFGLASWDQLLKAVRR